MAATTAVALGLPGRGFAQASGPGPVISALSAYMSAAATRALPADIAEQAKYHLLDTLAAVISGSNYRPARPPSVTSASAARRAQRRLQVSPSRPGRSTPRLPISRLG